MDASVRQILDPRILTAAYAQLPGNVLTPLSDAFYVGTGGGAIEEIDDDSFRSMYDSADITPAPGNLPGSEARVLSFGDAKERIFTMFYSFNSINFPEEVMKALREPDSYQLQNMGRTEINRIMLKFRNRQKRFRELVIAKCLTQGKVYMNAAGVVLESSSGAVTTSDFQLPAGNLGNLGGLMTSLFSTATTDIPSILESIDDQATSNSVPPPTDVWVNKVNLQYLRNNNAFKFWAQYNQVSNQQILNGGIIPDLWGKTWHFIGTKYTASDGTVKPYIPTTGQGSLVLTPPPGEPWCKTSKGLNLFPGDLNPANDIDAILGNIQKSYGEFAYAKLEHNPVRVRAFMGEKFGFNFNEPGAVWAATGF